MDSIPSREDFEPYFNVADETWEGWQEPLTLDDLDPAWVDKARAVATAYGLSWPPWLPEAEDFLCRNNLW